MRNEGGLSKAREAGMTVYTLARGWPHTWLMAPSEPLDAGSWSPACPQGLNPGCWRRGESGLPGADRPGRALSSDAPSRPLSSPQDSVYIFREGALPPYRQMFYQLCDLNVDEYVLRVGTVVLGTEAFPAPLLLGVSLRGKPCRGSRSWAASVSLVAQGAVSGIRLGCTPGQRAGDPSSITHVKARDTVPVPSPGRPQSPCDLQPAVLSHV